MANQRIEIVAPRPCDLCESPTLPDDGADPECPCCSWVCDECLMRHVRVCPARPPLEEDVARLKRWLSSLGQA